MPKKLLLILYVVIALDFGVASSILKMSEGLRLDVLNIGQGDAILITTAQQHHILIDGGPDNKVLSELSAVLPYLFSEIDLLVLTHPHEDHVVGLVEVLKRYKVKAVLMTSAKHNSLAYDAFLRETARSETKIYLADANRDFKFGSAYLDVLYPFEPVNVEMENVNNASVVIMLEEAGRRILLTGDAEKEVEAELLGLDLKADILKAGHHGSDTSSILPFLKKVNPNLMIISCGIENDYGHPAKETLGKASDLGIELLRTDLDGRISIIFGDQSWIRSIFAPRLRSFPSKFS